MKYHTCTQSFDIDTTTERNKHGTEGCVYLRGGTAIKLYFQPDQEKYEKVQYLIRHRPLASEEKLTAWPQEVVYDSSNRFAGYTMRKIEGHTFAEITERFAAIWDAKYLINVARSLIYCVDAIHRMGYCIGDFNPNNFFVTSQGQVIRLDIDSLHIESPNVYYPCGAAYPENTAPELLHQMRKQQVNRPADLPKGCSFTKESDLFCLYTLVFCILNKGYHPCTAQPRQTGTSVPSLLYRIQHGIRPYFTDDSAYRLPDDVPPLTHFPLSVRSLFQQCFGDGFFNSKARPTARRLYNELNKMYQQSMGNPNRTDSVTIRTVRTAKAVRTPKSPKPVVYPSKADKISILSMLGAFFGVLAASGITTAILYAIWQIISMI